MMVDVRCAKCGEPWDYYGVKNGDMSASERTEFLAGKGCPYCAFGSVCPSCDGSGREASLYKYSDKEHVSCSACGGTGKLGVEEELDLRAARDEMDATDEDGMDVLIRRGFL